MQLEETESGASNAQLGKDIILGEILVRSLLPYGREAVAAPLEQLRQQGWRKYAEKHKCSPWPRLIELMASTMFCLRSDSFTHRIASRLLQSRQVARLLSFIDILDEDTSVALFVRAKCNLYCGDFFKAKAYFLDAASNSEQLRRLLSEQDSEDEKDIDIGHYYTKVMRLFEAEIPRRLYAAREKAKPALFRQVSGDSNHKNNSDDVCVYLLIHV